MNLIVRIIVVVMARVLFGVDLTALANVNALMGGLVTVAARVPSPKT